MKYLAGSVVHADVVASAIDSPFASTLLLMSIPGNSAKSNQKRIRSPTKSNMPCHAAWFKSASTNLPINAVPIRLKPPGRTFSRTTIILPPSTCFPLCPSQSQRAACEPYRPASVSSRRTSSVHLDIHLSMVGFPDACSSVRSQPHVSTARPHPKRHHVQLTSPSRTSTDTKVSLPLCCALPRPHAHTSSSVNETAPRSILLAHRIKPTSPCQPTSPAAHSRPVRVALRRRGEQLQRRSPGKGEPYPSSPGLSRGPPARHLMPFPGHRLVHSLHPSREFF